LLAFPSPGHTLDQDTRALAVKALTLVNGVTWFDRRYYFETLLSPPPLRVAINRLSYSIFLAWHRLFRAPRLTGFGSAGTRTEAQQLAAQAYGQKLLAAVPPCALISFTDGSANPNPGPCGGGALLRDATGLWMEEAVAALGQGTNNLGELWGVGMAL
jgi:hypothetical protein